MPNPPKYNDFLEVGRVTKLFHRTEVMFVQFACPMDGCDARINVRADDVDKQKSSRCLHHLKRCSSIGAAGDSRVCGKRKSPSSDETPPTAQETHTVARHDLETRLDTVRAEKASSEAKVVDLEQRMRAMEERESVTHTRVAALEQFQAAIVHALGYTTPPFPTLEQCVLKIKGLEKSHAVASICDASSTEVKALRKELHRVEKAHQEKMKAAVENYNELLESNKTLRDQVYKLRMSGAGSSAKDSTKRDRQLMQLSHSDKCANASVEELRAKLGEVFRIVNEGRANA